MKATVFTLVCLLIFLTGCSQQAGQQPARAAVIENPAGTTLQTRFNPPEGFARKSVDPNSFAYYLRNLPLKPAGTQVRYYNGSVKSKPVYQAVVDMPISNKDLQQCADAVMRLRGEYLYARKEYDKISFTLTNGFKVDYSERMKGNRVVVSGNQTYWKKTAAPSNTYTDFRNYMEFVFMYAGSLSLSRELTARSIRNMEIGDVFIVGGSPGHAVIVVDMAEDKQGQKVFMLAQSYMPAQETQILKNAYNEALSPWYSASTDGELVTPEWTFTTTQLKTW